MQIQTAESQAVGPQKVEPRGYSVAEFCEAHRICRATFYNLLKVERGPALMKLGSRTIISVEAAAAWRRRMEAEAGGQKAA